MFKGSFLKNLPGNPGAGLGIGEGMACLTLKNVESKTTFKDGEKRRFRIVRVTGTCIEAPNGVASKIFGRKMRDSEGSFVKSCTNYAII